MLDPQESPEEINKREVELGLKVGFLLLQLFPNGGATDIVLVTLSCIAVGTVVAKKYRSDTALTFCCSGGGPRHPWSSGLAPVSSLHSYFPLCPRP